MKPQFSEVLKLKDGVLHNLPYHQVRINNTITKFRGKTIDLSKALSDIPFRQGIFKYRIVYGINGVESLECTPYTFRRIETIKLMTANNIEYCYKYTDRNQLNELLKQSRCDDIVIIKNGFVTDSSAANLVFESKEGLFTPNTYLLPGTKRQLLLDTGIIKEKCITINDLQTYNRIRFISAMIDLEDNIYVDFDKLSI